MKKVKSFKSFINESILLEGRYDSVVGEIIADTMKLVKNSNTPNGTYNGVKIRYTDKEDVPSFFELIEKGQFLEVGEYASEKSQMDIRVNLVLVRDEYPAYEDGFIVSGDAEDESGTIYIEISLDPKEEPQCYAEISTELRDVIRHEIEHLTQRGWNEKEGKFIRSNQAIRKRIAQNPDIRYKYYRLRDEVDANLQGLYAKAKSLKKPFKEVVMDFLNRQTTRGIIPEEKKMEIYNIWKRRASSIGGLPLL